MPAKSKKQQQFMAICAHTPGKARGACPSHAVAQEFSHKPKGGYRKKKLGSGSKHLQPRKDARGFY